MITGRLKKGLPQDFLSYARMQIPKVGLCNSQVKNTHTHTEREKDAHREREGKREKDTHTHLILVVCLSTNGERALNYTIVK